MNFQLCALAFVCRKTYSEIVKNELNSCTSENVLTISQRSCFICVEFRFDFRRMFKTVKFSVKSMAQEMKSQHEPSKKLINTRTTMSKEQAPPHSKNDWHKCPSGVFSLNGHLRDEESVDYKLHSFSVFQIPRHSVHKW